jgi:uncharacterized protein (DUF305 family)
MRRAALTAIAAAAALILVACGSDSMSGMDHDSSTESATTPPRASASTSTSADGHNASDVDFATQMIGHHRQAVDMADLAATRAKSSDVKTLAAKIKGAQGPEISTMSEWLSSWGENVPMEMGDDMEGMPMSSGMNDMPGMMSSEDMSRLKKASGAEFDTMFLTMMVTHHQGAIAMAQNEKSKGAYGPAKSLADSVITDQTAEITQMNTLLGKN